MEALGLGCLALATRSHPQADDGGRMSFLRADPGASFAQRMLSSTGKSKNLSSKVFFMGFRDGDKDTSNLA